MLSWSWSSVWVLCLKEEEKLINKSIISISFRTGIFHFWNHYFSSSIIYQIMNQSIFFLSSSNKLSTYHLLLNIFIIFFFLSFNCFFCCCSFKSFFGLRLNLCIVLIIITKISALILVGCWTACDDWAILSYMCSNANIVVLLLLLLLYCCFCVCLCVN